MKSGRTIAAEREQLETASERMQAREKARKKRNMSILTAVLGLVVLIVAGAVVWQQLFRAVEEPGEEKISVMPTVTIVDEAATGISARMQEYIGVLEQDLKDLGYTMIKATLPQDKIRELLIDVEGRNGYIKVNVDRGTAETAEDIDRMMRYFDNNGISSFEYVDVRIEGKAYYK